MKLEKDNTKRMTEVKPMAEFCWTTKANTRQGQACPPDLIRLAQHLSICYTCTDERRREKDDEEKTHPGTSINYAFRRFDPRLGRFLSIDPESSNFAFQSPYAYALNNPIRFVDRQGRGPGDAIVEKRYKGKGHVMIVIMTDDIQDFDIKRTAKLMYGWDIIAANDLHEAGKLVNSWYSNGGKAAGVDIETAYIVHHSSIEPGMQGRAEEGKSGVYKNKGIDAEDVSSYRRGENQALTDVEQKSIKGLELVFSNLGDNASILSTACMCGWNDREMVKELFGLAMSATKYGATNLTVFQNNDPSDTRYHQIRDENGNLVKVPMRIRVNVPLTTTYTDGWYQASGKDGLWGVTPITKNVNDAYDGKDMVPKVNPAGGFDWVEVDDGSGDSDSENNDTE